MKSSLTPAVVLVLQMLFFVLAAARVAAAERPNFIIILADDMGYADASCFGNDRYQTPHLDALAREGMRLTDFHANGPVCSPTRAALLTGRYQQRTGITGVVFADPARGLRDNHGLLPSEVTFAKPLQAAGYRTALFGKWHLGYAKRFNPMHHGFGEFRGFVSGNVDFHAHIDQAGFQDWWHGLELKDEPGYTTHLITKHAVRFIEEHRAAPFCLFVSHEAPHAPYQGPGDPPVRGPQARPSLEGAEIARAYREMMQEMDKGIGEVVATVKRLGLAERTMIFFFSDNGGTRHGNNGPLRGNKGSVWEGGVRVPAIAWWPGKIPAGSVVDATGMSMDLMPTMLDLAGVSLPARHAVDGVSLRRVLLENGALPERTLFWDYSGRQAVRRGPWKLLVNQNNPRAAPPGQPRPPPSGGGVLLFNLEADVGEDNDLAARHPERVQSMLAELKAWQADVRRSAAQR